MPLKPQHFSSIQLFFAAIGVIISIGGIQWGISLSTNEKLTTVIVKVDNMSGLKAKVDTIYQNQKDYAINQKYFNRDIARSVSTLRDTVQKKIVFVTEHKYGKNGIILNPAFAEIK